MSFPSRIICLTEETVESLYLLGRQELIIGVSQYVERPSEAKKLPVVAQFIRSDVEQIVSLRPDLVIGFSDIQKNIASDLIGRGLNVLVTNQRSLDEILNNILLLGRIIGEGNRAQELVDSFRAKLEKFKKISAGFPYRPRVYFEEWDRPQFSGIKWVSELIDACGGENIFADRTGAMAREREVTNEEVLERNPDIIFGCWCGKPVKLDSFAKRPGFENVKAIQKGNVWELPPAIFLQPGPALFVDGLDQMFEKIQSVVNLDV